MSKQPGSGGGKSFVYKEYNVGEETHPCGTPLLKFISLLFFFSKKGGEEKKRAS